jgi:molybdopterin converting factor subunit 1
MRVTVTLYARLAELAGLREWDVDLPTGATAQQAWEAAVEAHRPLDAMSGRVSCAVNAEFAPFGTRLHEGDDVAFLPPVSGGGE